jgi:DHA1 family tetracycline resistance protein-like MFS transporter
MNLRSIDRRLFTILMIVFVQMLGAAMILPILPLYARREFDLPPQQITLLVSAFFAAQFLAGPYLGRLSDKRGRLPILILSQIGTAVSFLLLALAPNAATLFAARILDGITGGNIIVAQAYITDITPREKRTQALGYIFAVFGIGFIVGPALGGVLSAALGPRIPYLVAAGAATLTVLLTYFALDETVTVEQRAANRDVKRTGLSPADIGRNYLLLLMMCIGFVGQFGMGMLQSTFALYGEAVLFKGYSEASTNLGIGLLLATVGVGQFTTQAVLLPRLVKPVGEARLVVAGSLLRALALFFFAVIASPWMAAIGSLAFAVGIGLMMPPLQSLATQTVVDELRGGVLGVFQSVVSLAIIMSTAIAGSIFAINPIAPYWIGGVLNVIIVLPGLILVGQSRAGKLDLAGIRGLGDQTS